MSIYKNIIQRNLPLDCRYTVIDKKYIPLSEQFVPCVCQNCGQLIANIATVKSVNGTYNIGFDCLETFLLNNNLLDGFSMEDLIKVKKMIPQVLRFSKELQDTFDQNKQINITGILFKKGSYVSDWIEFYYLQNGNSTSRDNGSKKLKGMDFDFLLTTLKNIFPKLQIISA